MHQMECYIQIKKMAIVVYVEHVTLTCNYKFTTQFSTRRGLLQCCIAKSQIQTSQWDFYSHNWIPHQMDQGIFMDHKSFVTSSKTCCTVLRRYSIEAPLHEEKQTIVDFYTFPGRCR